jgi:hypothetical protein
MKQKDQLLLEQAYLQISQGKLRGNLQDLTEAVVDNNIKIQTPFFIKNVGWFTRLSRNSFRGITDKVPINLEVFLKRYSGKSILPIVKTQVEFERQLKNSNAFSLL